jgi:heat shock protein HslJ
MRGTMDDDIPIETVPESEAIEKPSKPAPMGRNFYLVMALIGFMVFLILFINVPGMKASAATTLTQTNWTLKSLTDGSGTMVPVQNTTIITAKFDTRGTVNGFSGCNNYSAAYTMKDYSLTITKPIITALDCSSPGIMDQESEYMADLVKAYEIRINDSDLNIYDSTGNVCLVFTRSGF